MALAIRQSWFVVAIFRLTMNKNVFEVLFENDGHNQTVMSLHSKRCSSSSHQPDT